MGRCAKFLRSWRLQRFVCIFSKGDYVGRELCGKENIGEIQTLGAF